MNWTTAYRAILWIGVVSIIFEEPCNGAVLKDKAEARVSGWGLSHGEGTGGKCSSVGGEMYAIG